jgi:hypothetical protein
MANLNQDERDILTIVHSWREPGEEALSHRLASAMLEQRVLAGRNKATIAEETRYRVSGIRFQERLSTYAAEY